ncbi:MAG: ATP-binding protein [Gemmatimonadota bacterium]|nr:ATP-binding protein [Gemmatimonadota bacterium]
MVVVLSAALNGHRKCGADVESILGQKTALMIREALPPRTRGWRVLPVVGRRDRPAQVIGEAISKSGFLMEPPPESWTDTVILDTLETIAALNPRAGGGLIIFIDEMGKFLEAAANDGLDIYLFQELAERASRSSQRLIVVGILHQAFQEYAHRLSRDVRDEWSKIQGRFVDLVVNTSGEEQIDLIGRAIESDIRPKEQHKLARAVAQHILRQTSGCLVGMLEDCWPLHPIVACLLGPISRRRYGQNQRSIFGFLNSAEPQGFQDFLHTADDNDIYGPERLWDYLRINLEPSILASPDGHRWALAVDALERCEARGGQEIDLRLLKVIAVVDMYKDRSGLAASRDLLALALPDQGSVEVENALVDLQRRSFVIYRKFTESFSIFEGSDFDAENAVEQALVGIGEVDFTALNALAGLQPIVAKRHYHKTGALRWFDVVVVPLAEVEQAATEYAPRHGAIGGFVLTIPTQNETEAEASEICRRAARNGSECDIVVGLSVRAWRIPALAVELLALKRVQDETPELRGDSVARIEIEGRVSTLQGRLESELVRVLDSASWCHERIRHLTLRYANLNSLASDLADTRFESAPRIHNELLGRVNPSSNGVAARNTLLGRMALYESEHRLGIKGFPAERGLFASLLERTGLHAETANGWRFVEPGSGTEDPHNLGPTWEAAKIHLRSNANRSVSVAEIYDIWRKAPYGIKDGLLPILAAAFLLSQRTTLACYREGIFLARVSELDMEILARDPADIRVRWMDLSEMSRRLLSEMADIVRDLDEENTLTHLEPIDVAKGLVSIFDRLHPWVGRTQRLSRSARRIRQLFKQANDPNKLIFDDLPRLLPDAQGIDNEDTTKQIAARVLEGLTELRQAYPTMLNRMRETLLEELQVPNASPSVLSELRARADNVRELSGDHRQEAFIVRLAGFAGTDEDMAGLAGMALNKPIRDWVDMDIDRATVELATMAQRFIRTEAFARVKGRRDKRNAMAVIVGMGGQPTLLHDEFEITERDQPAVKALIDSVDGTLQGNGQNSRAVILAALAELSARYMDPQNSSTPRRMRRSDT